MEQRLNQEWVPRIRANFEKKPLEELVAIYAVHDESEWSPEAFSVIREILQERGVTLPQVLPKSAAEGKGPNAIRVRSFQGCEYLLYGQRDFRGDGSYLTTQWFVLFAIPLFPIRSLRVRIIGVPDRGRFGSSPKATFGSRMETDFAVDERTRPNLRQVCCVYGFVLLLGLWLFGFAEWTSAHGGSGGILNYLLFAIGVGVLFLVPTGLRYLDKRRACIEQR